MINVRTDLAVEAREIYKNIHKREADGVIFKEDEKDDIKITTVEVTTPEGAEKIGKSIGKYITVDIPEYTHYDGELMDDVSKVVADYLADLIEVKEDKTALVIGLGNRNITPDALGPKVVEQMMITRHLKKVMPDTIDDSVRSVCALSPGVLGITGIETVEIVKAVVDKIKPSLVICIDALAARNLERINKTIQIGSTGISPGAGVGNNREGINEQSLGVPVIAIGVPTVVYASTIVNDSIDNIIDGLMEQTKNNKAFFSMLKDIDKNEKSELIKSMISEKGKDMIVTPKEIDVIIESVSKIISMSINKALQPNLEMEDINKFMN